MLVGTFHQKIRLCNPKLRFLGGGDESKPIALYFIDDFKTESICGTDRGLVPEFMQYDEVGHIVKAGWRRTVDILISKGYVSKQKAALIFGACFDKGVCRHRNTRFVKGLSHVDKAIADASGDKRKVMINGKQEDSTPMKRDDIMDISKMINKGKEN